MKLLEVWVVVFFIGLMRVMFMIGCLRLRGMEFVGLEGILVGWFIVVGKVIGKLFKVGIGVVGNWFKVLGLMVGIFFYIEGEEYGNILGDCKLYIF